ncbi:MAG: HD domain-containing protein [Actinobacteria bacterium]|nr:HD domain-containing protein [Actinomycetota bacterium]
MPSPGRAVPRVGMTDERRDQVAGRYQEILELARPYLDTRGNEEHTEGSVAFAWQLLDAEGGDPDVVIPGVILHDVGWSEVREDEQLLAFGPASTRPDLNRLHEEKGAEIAAAILASIEYDPRLIEEIAEIVRGHDSRLEALSPNDALVKDADKLFRLTRRGYYIFWEWFPLDFRQYLAPLAKVDEWFFTATAKRLADEMFADLESYVDELERESRAEPMATTANPGSGPPAPDRADPVPGSAP